MKKLLKLNLLLMLVLFTGQQVFAQLSYPQRGDIAIYPENPGPSDSVFLNYIYISTDGCPDFTLMIDSLAPGKIHVKLDKIIDSTRFCTLAISKFRLTLNLGCILQPTDIYLNHLLIKRIFPACIPDRIGKVMGYTDKSTLIEEDSTKLIFQIFNQTLKMGTVVKFNGTEIQCIKAPCYNIVNCFRIADILPPPPCEQNRKGIIVQGKDACAKELFIQEYSPISSSLQLWKPGLITADAYFKPGDLVVFGGIKVAPDTAQSFYCRIVGLATCMRKIQDPVIPVEPVNAVILNGIALTDSAIVQSGYAVLFSKESRRALASTQILDGKFAFKGIKNASYTVFVVPDKRMYPGYLPTFYMDKAAWKTADFISLTDSVQNIQVKLRKYIPVEGRGKIYGNIHYENNYLKDTTLIRNGVYTESRDTSSVSACNIPVILYSNTLQAIAWTLTDANGYYSFDNVQSGIYSVIAETPAAAAVSTVSIVDENTQQNTNLMLKSTEVNTDINMIQVKSIHLYPNPVVDECTVIAENPGILNIYTISGQLIHSCILKSGKNELNMQQLQSGLYLVKFGDEVFKLKKH